MNSLVKITLPMSLFLILFLLILANLINPSLLTIKQAKQQNNLVRIQAEITDIKETASLYLLTVKDSTDTIIVTLSKKNNENILNLRSKTIEITGKITEFNNELELSANKIQVLK